MLRLSFIFNLFFFFLFCNSIAARTYTEEEWRDAWNKLKKKPITEQTFRQACDLMQDIGSTNLSLSYEILAEFVPQVKATSNRRWLHILLSGWAKAKESTGYFADAEKLYGEVLQNTTTEEVYYREAVVAMVLMYAEWGKMDSLNKWFLIGEALCRKANDNENLSFLYGFKAVTSGGDTTLMRTCFQKAISLARDIPDKNALFTATYNYAYMYLQNDLQKQVEEFGFLLELSKDSSLNRYPRKLYDRTAFTFRNAGPSVYYNLMQINMLLTDYENAWKFAELFYNATIKPNPSSINAPYFNAEFSIVKSFQKDYLMAQDFLDSSRSQFKMAEDSIPYLSYFLAAGLLSENQNNFLKASAYYKKALQKGNTQSQHMVPPEIYYARVLIRLGNLEQAEGILNNFKPLMTTRKYSAIGLSYFQSLSDLYKSRKDNGAFASSLAEYFEIKDSLTNINRYRAVMEIETRMRLLDKEQQIKQLDQENKIKKEELQKERIFYGMLIGIALLAICLLAVILRNRTLRNRQQEIVQKNNIEQMEKMHRLEVMQGAIDAEENERHKIADQLHDETAGMLALASLNISSVLEKDQWNEQAVVKLAKAHQVVTLVSTSIRDISHRLTPLIIEKYGFKKAIEDLGYSVSISEKLNLQTVIIGFENSGKYSIGKLNNIYRIVQELVHNVIKHSEASEAMLELVEHENVISVLVEDNGIGIGEYALSKGKGLKAIQSKIAYLKGQIEITKKNNGGTLVVIEIPSNDL